MSKVFDNPDHAKARTLFRRVLTFKTSRAEDVGVIAIVHLVDSAIPFLPVLNERYEILSYLAKPSSIQSDVDAYLSAALPDRQHVLSKESFRDDPGAIVREILSELPSNRSRARIILLDIGGYFVSSGANSAACSASMHKFA